MFIKGEIHTNMLFLCYCSCYTQFKSGSNSRRKGGAEEMRLIGNILWIIFGGFISALGWLLTGCLWCITIIGIPVGLQCFKLASISLNPFGKEIRYEGEAVSFLLNVIWFLVSGWLLALGNFLLGLVLCITIVGIPFGKQFFKIAKLALRPFGAVVVRTHVM